MASVAFTTDTVSDLMELVDEHKGDIKEHTYIQICNLLMHVRTKSLEPQNSTRPSETQNLAELRSDYTSRTRTRQPFSTETNAYYTILKYEIKETAYMQGRIVSERIIPGEYEIVKKHTYTKKELLEKIGRRSCMLTKDKIADILLRNQIF